MCVCVHTLICTQIVSFLLWEVKCKVCELVDMICFASKKKKKIAEVT